MELHGIFLWNSMENIDGEISMETGFLIVHGIPWQPFSWNSMEIDVLILHGVQWRIFHGGFSHG